MNKKDIMYNFIKIIENKNLLTSFINTIFEYKNLSFYNYIFRIIDENNQIIIDIYDNISDNRFNRYIFNFSNQKQQNININDNVCVTYININNINKKDTNLYKFAYLFNLENNLMIEYAQKILNQEFINILEDIINKPIL